MDSTLVDRQKAQAKLCPFWQALLSQKEKFKTLSFCESRKITETLQTACGKSPQFSSVTIKAYVSGNSPLVQVALSRWRLSTKLYEPTHAEQWKNIETRFTELLQSARRKFLFFSKFQNLTTNVFAAVLSILPLWPRSVSLVPRKPGVKNVTNQSKQQTLIYSLSPRQAKEVLTWHLISLKIIVKYFCTAHYSLKMLKFNFGNNQSKTLLRFIRWAGRVCGTWYKIVNDRMGVHRVWEAKRAFALRLEIGIKNQIFLENLKSVS